MDIRHEPDIPEGINYSRESPLKEFMLLTGGLLLALISMILILGLFADHFARYVPFSAELKIASLQEQRTSPPPPIEKYLQRLADRLAAAQALPADMSVTVRYRPDNIVNAFATLGGRIVVFRGLLEKLHSENSVAMVLAHEIAHIKYRHPIRSAGRAAVIGLAMTMVNSTAGNDMLEDIFGQTGLLTAMKFSRTQEQQADLSALGAVESLYGHINGADELFQYLLQEESRRPILLTEFYSSHPLTENRIVVIHEQAQVHGWPSAGRLTPLPHGFADWLHDQEAGETASNEK